MKFNKDIVISETDEGAVVLDEGKGTYWQLNPVAAAIALSLREGVSVAEIPRALVETFDVSIETAQADVDSFVTQLKEANVIR